MHHSAVSWKITLPYFLSQNVIWYGQKESIKMQNFKLSLNDMECHQLCALIGSFCWKYVKFQLKKYGGVISHDTEEWCKIWRKTDLLFGKWHEEFGKFLPQYSKVSKLRLWWKPFIQSRKCMSWKFTDELYVMTKKND